MYHLDVGGHQITNLRLSPKTLMEIFTGQITNWDDPQITKDYGAQLPNLPITPVVRSDGSGATYFFTRWMSHDVPVAVERVLRQGHPRAGQLPAAGRPSSTRPRAGATSRRENGSNNVATYITSSYANGAIGYDEYAYALNSHYPVVAGAEPGRLLRAAPRPPTWRSR